MYKTVEGNNEFAIGIILSYFALVFVISEMKFCSNKFMSDPEIAIFNSFIKQGRLRNSREIASLPYNSFEIKNFKNIDYVDLNKQDVDGVWVIFNKVNKVGTIKVKNVKVYLNLLSNEDGAASVAVKEMSDLENKFPKHMSIVFFQKKSPKEMLLYLSHKENNHSEADILVAKKIISNIKTGELKIPLNFNNDKKTRTQSQGDEIAQDSSKLAELKIFDLIGVLVKGNNTFILNDQNVTGTLKFSENNIELLSANIKLDSSMDLDIEINKSDINNNYFQYNLNQGDVQVLSGVINRSGEQEFIVTLVNGPYAGAKLKYYVANSTDQIDSMVENVNENMDAQSAQVEQQGNREFEEELREREFQDRAQNQQGQQGLRDQQEQEQSEETDQNEILRRRYEQAAELSASVNSESDRGNSEQRGTSSFKF